MNEYHPHNLRVCLFGPHRILLDTYQLNTDVYPELLTSISHKNILKYQFLFIHVKMFILSTSREYNIIILLLNCINFCLLSHIIFIIIFTLVFFILFFETVVSFCICKSLFKSIRYKLQTIHVTLRYN